MSAARGDITRILERFAGGDEAARDEVARRLYEALHQLAAGYLNRERADHTLQPTALINEAWMRLVDQTRTDFESRNHFLAIAATTMRRILVDHARAKARQKRAAPGQRVALTDNIASENETMIDLIALDDALAKLEHLDERKMQVIELRFFAGLEVEEAAAVLGISPATVKRDWQFARLWLMREMDEA